MSANMPGIKNDHEELLYWKGEAERLSHELLQQRQEAEEFEMESRQLEKELELTISQNEKTIKKLNIANSRAQNELESLKLRLEQSTKENANLDADLSDLKKEKSELMVYIRELEQQNDDLERSRRIVEGTLQGFETALNNAIERNVMLESEVDETDTLKEKLQRLVDETRDLKQELVVKEKERLPDNDRSMNGFKMDSNKLKEIETQTTPIKRDPSLLPPLPPASRALAMNLVGDIIRKIGLSRFLCSECGRYKCTECCNSSGEIAPSGAKHSNTPRA